MLLIRKQTTCIFDTYKNNLENPAGSELPSRYTVSHKNQSIYIMKNKKTEEFKQSSLPAKALAPPICKFLPQIFEQFTLQPSTPVSQTSARLSGLAGILHPWSEQEGESHLHTSSHRLFHLVKKSVVVFPPQPPLPKYSYIGKIPRKGSVATGWIFILEFFHLFLRPSFLLNRHTLGLSRVCTYLGN